MTHYRHLADQLLTLYEKSEAEAIARMVMEEVFGLGMADLLLDKDNTLSANDVAKLRNIAERLVGGEPVQYVLGHAWFCGCPFMVTPDVLIPRPETEELVERTARRLAEMSKEQKSGLDVGTGSGCIAISLAKRDSNLRMTAIDISEDALRVAQKNADSIGVNVDFVCRDILTEAPLLGTYDVIVSNPPYICNAEAKDMARNVLDHEPSNALFVPDDDPLLFYRSIARKSTKALMKGGWLLFEINRAYGHEVQKLLTGLGFCNVSVIRDQFGNDRICEAQWMG